MHSGRSEARCLAIAVDCAALALLLAGWVLFEILDTSPELRFWIIEFALSLYVVNRLYIANRVGDEGILTPLGMFFFFQFLIQVLVGNLSLLFYTTYFNAGWDYLYNSMVVMALAAIALMMGGLFRGFRDIGARIHDATIGRIDQIHLNVFVCIAVLIGSTCVYLFSMSIGVIGYADSDTAGTYASTSSFSQYLIYVADAGYIVLLLSYYVKLTDPNKKSASAIFYVSLTVRIVLALLNGMRSELFFIVLCLAITHYIVRRAIPKWVALIPLIVIFSYGIYDSYRALLREDGGSRAELILAAASSSRLELGETVVTVLSRLNLTESLSAILQYANSHVLGSDDPSFLLDLVLLPITTFVPRALIPWKSMSTYGLWVTREVYGAPATVMSSAYVTIEGFFYLAGGILLVFFGFLILGMLLNFVGGLLNNTKNNPVAASVFMMLCYKVLFEAATPIDIVTGCVRGVLIYSLFSYLLVATRVTASEPVGNRVRKVQVGELRK